MMLKRACGAALALALAAPALASQSNLYSPTTGIVSGLALTLNYNAAFASLASSNSGASAPTNTQSGVPYLGMWWLNTSTTPPTLSLYDGASWLAVGSVDTASHVWQPVVGGGYGTLAAGSTTDLGSVPQTSLTITGTATISSLGTSATVGSIRFLTFQSSGSVLTASSSLILPGGANITTDAGDTAVAVQTSSTAWTVAYMRADGRSVETTGYVPSGAVMSFALTSCPAGWVIADGSGGTANMRGVVARGYDPSNTRDPAGSAQIVGSYETDMLEDHVHSLSGTTITSGGAGSPAGFGFFFSTPTVYTTNPVTGSHGAETRVKSTILLYCQKT